MVVVYFSSYSRRRMWVTKGIEIFQSKLGLNLIVWAGVLLVL